MSYKPLVILMISILLIIIPAETEGPVECGPYELFTWCNQRNEPTCRTPKSSGAWECDGYCICQKSFVRDDEGKCIPMEKCPKLRCPKASVFEQCSKNYKQLCLKAKGRKVDNACTPGCSCIPGYCWEERSKSCIKIGEYFVDPNEMEFLRIG